MTDIFQLSNLIQFHYLIKIGENATLLVIYNHIHWPLQQLHATMQKRTAQGFTCFRETKMRSMCDTLIKYYQQVISIKTLQKSFFANTIAIFYHQLKIFRFFKVRSELTAPISVVFCQSLDVRKCLQCIALYWNKIGKDSSRVVGLLRASNDWGFSEPFFQKRILR